MKKAFRIGLQIEKNRAHGRALIQGIADYALSHADWQLELLEPQQLASDSAVAQFDGLIVRIMDDTTEHRLLASGRCVIDTYGRHDRVAIDTFRLDDRAIAQMAGDYFLEHRYESLAYCGFPGLRFSNRRGEAFCQVAAGRGARISAYLGHGKLRDTFFRNERLDALADTDALRQWLKALPKPVAIFCCNDLRALQVLGLCRKERLDVPHEVAVLGVDNDSLLCTFTQPSLSSIDTDPFSLGQRVAERLDRRLSIPKGRQFAPMLTLHAPRRICERASSAAYSFATPWVSDALVYIHRHLHEGISATDVIRHVGYSHTTVQKVFAREVGRSVQQEIMRQRLTRACRLLKETERTALRIATDCGYPSAQYFASFFATRMKATPDAWRKSFKAPSGSRR